jgi:5,10-methylenetetrahydromethanopterin reductase
VQGLLRGETLDWEFEDKRKKIRFLDPDIGAINIKDEIPIHVSAFGPKGRSLTARLGAGWINGSSSLAHGKAALAAMQASWKDTGRDPASLYAVSTIAGCIMKPGETYDSPRVKAQAGPNANIALHSLAEREDFGDLGLPVPPALQALVDRYRQVYMQYEPADARYLSNHRGHLMYLRPEEQQFATPELIRNNTWTGSKEEIRDRLRDMKAAGYKHLGLTIGYKAENKLEDWIEVFEAV